LADDQYLSYLLDDPTNWHDGACSDPDKQLYEWEHSVPRPDPQNYTDAAGTLMTYPFNHQFTTKSEAPFDAFKTRSGLAMIRHFTLNENTMTTGGDSAIGYFVSDVDRAGRFSMLGEAQALAFGDPKYLGYLAASSFTRGFPVPARQFNAAFLALPAVDSQILPGAASDDEVIVRSYETAKHGTFLAIVNTAMTPKYDVVITLPSADLAATDRVTMQALPVTDDSLTVSLAVAGVLAVQLLPDAGVEDPLGGDQGDTNCACSTGAAPQLGWLGLLLAGLLLGLRERRGP
jgi:MYXO-CTERM domain-containing protein